MMATRFVWRRSASDVAAFCRNCVACQRAKVTKQPAAPTHPITVPGRQFSHIHVDLVGPLPVSSSGFSHLLTIIDRTTRWVEAVPLRSTSAACCADALVATWISRFGVPALLTSDRGVQFTSALWGQLCNKLGIKQLFTTAYHPQLNGMIERWHRQLKDALRARLAGSDWPEHLPWVLLSLRTTPKEDAAVSSAELVFGSQLCLPGEWLADSEQPASSFLQELCRRLPVAIPTRPLS